MDRRTFLDLGRRSCIWNMEIINRRCGVKKGPVTVRYVFSGPLISDRKKSGKNTSLRLEHFSEHCARTMFHCSLIVSILSFSNSACMKTPAGWKSVRNTLGKLFGTLCRKQTFRSRNIFLNPFFKPVEYCANSTDSTIWPLTTDPK